MTLASDNIWLATLPCVVLLAEAVLAAADAGVAALGVMMMMVVAGRTDQHNESACQSHNTQAHCVNGKSSGSCLVSGPKSKVFLDSYH